MLNTTQQRSRNPLRMSSDTGGILPTDSPSPLLDLPEWILTEMDQEKERPRNSPAEPKRKSPRQKGIASKFSLHAKTLFLTYPKCPLTPQEGLSALKALLPPMEEYIVAQETHKDLTKHLHAYVKLSRNVNYKDSKCLDLGQYHGNYQSCRSPTAVKEYCVKEDNFLTNLDTSTLRKPNVWMEARTLARDQSLLAALQHLERTPQGAMQLTINGATIIRGLQALTKKPLMIHHSLDTFQIPTTWKKEFSLVLTGPTGSGKTALAKALLPNALMINHIDRLREYNSLYDGVIFDDMDFHHYPRESHIHLVDTYEERDIHGRNVNGRLPADTPRIFTTNKRPHQILMVDDPAVRRRVVAWEVLGPNTITEIVDL